MSATVEEQSVAAEVGSARGGATDERFGSWLLITGGCLTALVVLMALAAPLLGGAGPTEILSAGPLSPPGGGQLLGTDTNGMDVWSRVLHAGRVDLGIAVVAVTLAVAVGTAIGLLAGYLGGWFDELSMRAVDVFQAFPTFILALAVAAILGSGPVNLTIVIALVNAPAYARLVRAEARTVRELPFIEAARTSGTSTRGILLTHVLPNCLTPVRVIAPLNCGWAMLTLAGLSFLGLGIQVPQAEWGAMISQGASDAVAGRWWTSVPPGLALVISVFGFSLIGEGLQERSRRRVS